MNKPTVSERFDVEDIRKIREYNSLRLLIFYFAQADTIRFYTNNR